MQSKNVMMGGLAVLCGLLLALSAYGEALKSGETDLILLAAPPAGWTTLEPPRSVEGHQLFTVINGGAERYVRLGFDRAVFAAYKSVDGKSVNLEIYRMKTAAAAREIYVHKSGEEGRAVKLGDGGRLADYYLNFYRGPWQITVSGYDADDRTVAALEAIAGQVDARLKKPQAIENN